MDINTYDVIEAAGTKWSFLKFYPGLVGGICNGFNSYYLVHKTKHLGYHNQVFDASRYTNVSMYGYMSNEFWQPINTSLS